MLSFSIITHILTFIQMSAQTDSVKGLPKYAEVSSDIFTDWIDKVGSAFSQSLNHQFLIWLSVVGLACVVYLVVTLCRSISNIRNTSLLPVFIFTWIYGFLVYDIGMYTEGAVSLLTNAPMALLYGFKIFLLDSDVSEIQHDFHTNWLFSGNFALVHFLAAFVTFLFVVKHFGYNLMARLRMWHAAFGHKVDEVFVFWGFNEPVRLLAESIQNRLGKPGKNYKIIIVRTSQDDDDSPEGRTGLNRILDFLSMKNSELDKINKIKCLSTCSFKNFSNLDIDLSSEEEIDVLGKVLRLKSLKRILERRVRSKIHMLFLSKEEMENIYAVSLMCKDITIKGFAGDTTPDYKSDDVTPEGQPSGRCANLYCHARHNSVHRVIEDKHSSLKIIVKVVDSSHINVETLKKDKENEDALPVNYVDVEADATVSSPFNALVVGFSEVGQDCLRFLYEFGAFVRTGSTDGCVRRSVFHMDVVDKNMANISGAFVANAPAINPSMPFIDGRENHESLITLHQMDCRSAEFYLKLEEWIKKLNYVVIATEDDELNVSVAVRIFKLALRYGTDMDKFIILVRVHEDDGHISNIVRHYNLLWAAQKAVPGFNTDHYNGKDYRQLTVERSHKVTKPLFIFGQDKNIYTYKNIIDDALHRNAVQYKERYECSSNPEHIQNKEGYKSAWLKEFVERMQLDKKAHDYYPSYSGLMGLRRCYGQDMANCLHSATKTLLAQKACSKAGLPEFEWSLFSRKYKTISYTLSNGEDANPMILRILDVLAQTEHLRWNASHEILGYVQYGTPSERNEVKMQHSCIIPWEDLSVKIKSYDYNVVDVTLNIINPDRPIQK